MNIVWFRQTRANNFYTGYKKKKKLELIEMFYADNRNR